MITARLRGWSGIALGLLAVGCGSGEEPGEASPAAGPAPPNAPTFTRDVAPILFANCVECHREGQSAPFPLWSYTDARNKRRQIVRVTERRLMPPWLPEEGHVPFTDERRLTPRQIATLARWVEVGAPEGDPADLPARPVFVEGWRLGPPDVVVELAEPFEVPADGPELFRNLILEVPTEELRYVRAVEILPRSPAAHHGILQVDRDRRSRSLSGEDGQQGFSGMSLGFSVPPDGHFLGWTPGKGPCVAPEGMAWRLHPRSDLVLQLHLTPTGKAEPVRPRIGLYFTDEEPRVSPVPVVLYSEAIDIPAGERDYLLEDELRLPVATRLHGLYPHAHYLCREMLALAELPTGEARTLLHIVAWDFDWQDDYRLVQPMDLPAGTRLRIEYRYDNSDGNPANPNLPAKRVRFGQRSVDEMGTLTLTLVPQAGGPVERWERELALREAICRRNIERKSYDWDAHRKLALVLRDRGDLPGAVASLEEALRLRPEYPEALTDLGACLGAMDQPQAAEQALRRALAIDPDLGAARLQLARLHASRSDLVGAEAQVRAALRTTPDLLEAHVLLGTLLARRGETTGAIEQFEKALALSPSRPEIHNNLATAHFEAGHLQLARQHYTEAVARNPDYFNAWFNLGRVLAALGEKQESRKALERARALNPDHPGPKAALDSL